MSMTTGEALKLVNEFGADYLIDSFMDTIEVLDIHHELGLLSPRLSEAYLVTIGELESTSEMALSA